MCQPQRHHSVHGEHCASEGPSRPVLGVRQAVRGKQAAETDPAAGHRVEIPQRPGWDSPAIRLGPDSYWQGESSREHVRSGRRIYLSIVRIGAASTHRRLPVSCSRGIESTGAIQAGEVSVLNMHGHPLPIPRQSASGCAADPLCQRGQYAAGGILQRRPECLRCDRNSCRTAEATTTTATTIRATATTRGAEVSSSSRPVDEAAC